MNRLALTLIGTLALCGITQAASAQNQNTTSAFSQNLEVRINGDKLDNEPTVYIGKTRCDETEDIEYEFKGFTYNSPNGVNVELWGSAGSSVNCNTASNRTTTTTSTPQCWFIGDAKSVTTTASIKAQSSDVFKESGAEDASSCPEVSGTVYTVYLVPVDTPTSSNPSNPPEPVSGIQQLKATFTLNLVTPASPSKVKGGTGESELTLSWEKASDAKPKSKYYTLWDLTIGTDSTCAQSVLAVDSQPPKPEEGSIVKTSDTVGTKAKLSDLDARGVAIGDYVAATVIHLDQAGNPSNIGDVECIERVEIDDFYKLCAQDPKCNDGFHTCAMNPGRREYGAAGFGLAFVIGSLLFLRRRRA